MKTALALLLVLLSFVSTQASPAPECQWGPSYWCQSKETAVECGQEAYCSKQAWKLQAEPERVGSVQCDVCELVVKLVEQEVINNKTETEAQQALDDLCSKLGSLGDECKTLVDSYFPQIWQMLINKADPDSVCSAIGLCKSSSIKASPEPVGSVQCDVCKILVGYVDKYIDDNNTESEAQALLKDVCDKLGALKDECDTVVTTYFPDIWKLLVDNTDPDTVCSLIKLCTSSLMVEPMVEMSIGSIECVVCEGLVKEVEKLIETNKTEEEAEEALDKFCEVLGSFKEECQTMVNTFFPQIWDMVINELSADEICKAIKACSSSKKVADSYLKLSARKPKLSMPKDSLCDLCKLAANFLKTYVDSNTTEAEVKKALEGLCAVLPSGMKDECTKLVDENFDTIWKLVQAKIDSGEICQQLGLCNSTRALVKRPVFKPTLPKQATGCDICKLVVSFTKPYVDNNSTEAEVKEALAEVCNLLPASDSGQCNTLLTTFFPMIWDMVKSEFDNDKICSKIGVCNSTATFKKVNVAVGDSTLCTLCKTVSGYVRELIENNKTKEEVKDELESFCKELPAMNDTCVSLVDTYFDMIWNLIDSYVDDDDLCKELKICNSSTTLNLKQELSGPLCVICEFVMKELESMLDSNSTEAEIDAALKKVCSLLPASVKTDCDEFVVKYGNDIIKLLLDAAAPKAVCTLLGLCAAAEMKTIVMPVVESGGLKDECSTCKLLLGFVKTLVENYQEPIEDALKDVCGLMPSTIQGECTDFVKEFAPAIIELVDKEINPEEICKDLKICTESALMAPWKKLARAKSF